jgi:hypothetical protein
MKCFTLLVLAIAFCLHAVAQNNADSLAYELQRKKINAMLTERAQKFGQYDASLSMHTGIFGLQTKKDIRRSNEILMDIVKTDNGIFKELKVLLDYRAYQQKQVQNRTAEIESSNLAYMGTINRLRNQNEQLKKELAGDGDSWRSKQKIFVITIIVLILASISLLVRLRTARKA